MNDIIIENGKEYIITKEWKKIEIEKNINQPNTF